MNYLNCVCPHCEQNLEYPEDGHGQVINCPVCQKPLTLPQKPESRSFVSLFIGKIKEARQSAANRILLKSVLMDVVADGVLTAQEIERVEQVMSEAGLTHQDIAGYKLDLFRRAIDVLVDRGFDSEKLAGVDAIQTFLRIHEAEIPKERTKLERMRYLAQIREKGPQSVSVANLVLKSDEHVYWVQPATLYEEKIVSRRYEGGSSGVSIRVMKGVSFRVGNHRGHIVSDSVDVPICQGEFIITSRRLIFRGERKSFDTKYENLLDIRNQVDGIFYSERNKQKQRRIQYSQPNSDIIVEILSYAVSHAEAA